MSKTKILNIGLILTSLIGYTEWGTNNSMFVFQEELNIIHQLITNPSSAAHPLTLLPLLGQILLLITLFQKKVNTALTYMGITGLTILFILFLAVGVLSSSLKVIFFSLPFLTLAFFTVRHLRKNSIAKL